MHINKILLVDDDEALVNSFSSILRKEGYYVETATSGEQTLDKVRKNRFNLAILDIKLPEIMGDVIAKTLRKQDDEIIIILITGYTSFQDSIDALDIGIYDILMKPIGPRELTRIIKEALSQNRSLSRGQNIEQLAIESIGIEY